MSEALFVKASREKIRFPYKGKISVEDLWDLPVTELDKIYKTLNADMKKNQEDSLLEKKSDADNTLTAQLDIIKYVVMTKLEEAKARAKERELAEQKQTIMSIIASKKNEELHGKSVEELEKILDNLK